MRSLSLGLLLAVASASPLIGDVAELTSLPSNVTDWEEQVVAMGYSLEPPEIDHEFLNFTLSKEDEEHVALAKRQNCYNRAVVTETTQNFVDWDVQMSPVVCAVGAMTINVLEGYSVSNGVSVSAGMDYTWIADKLKSSFGVDFTRTWTTTTSITTTGTVPDGNCGCMIWKPLTTRRYGSVMEGCIGNLKKTGTFMADDRGNGQYNGVKWIAGARSMCYKRGTNPPVSRCQGSGNFI
ncbi:hypothetical protein BS50DRAFT_522086 [Corynespora cassiicola Philippines]|uniref:Ecp2 effector protein domain-containing protein n=1 Tax=Corynespora cassiicola Philippines TaxID=1448308 RepID=A0A2T2NVN1_CORCC|nr:hypothetical protein BS50DRAFT_522086 [Corynespora cassiicola Philippines]